MKKKIKNIIPMLCVGISLFTFGLIKVDARTCSPYMINPYMYQVYPYVYGNVESVNTSYSSCRAENTGVYFSGFKTISDSDYLYDDAVVHMYLYEDDPPGNDDEMVKKYQAIYFDKEISRVGVTALISSGNIDSAGDQTCELYMSFMISGQQGGPTLDQNLFTYRMCME